jgi:hypothetical protein
MSRFPVLKFVANVLRFLGWTVVAVGAAFFVNALIHLGAPPPQIIPGVYIPYVGSIPLIVSAYTFVWGIFMVASGEAILVLLAIEENTRRKD